jgi:hypothetical protein
MSIIGPSRSRLMWRPQRPFADIAPEQAAGTAAALVHQLRVAVWATGAPSAAALGPGHLRDARLA